MDAELRMLHVKKRYHQYAHSHKIHYFESMASKCHM